MSTDPVSKSAPGGALKRVCVFCGSNSGRPDIFTAAARGFGKALARRGIGLVYGGGRVGLMGELADAALAAGGHVVGVIPGALMDKELGHTGVQELLVVGTMHGRKAKMAELSDAFVALPGGFGTLDELCEALTWSQLGLHAKPCAVLDVGGYFGPLLELLDRAVEHGFLPAESRALLLEDTDPDRLLERLAAWRPARREKWIGRKDI